MMSTVASDATGILASQAQARTHAAYNDGIIRQFVIMTIVWGVVGMLVGVVIENTQESSGATRRRRGSRHLWRVDGACRAGPLPPGCR
jgi:heme/copper-type cytochrome/quinol oxidase subunit 2